MSSFDDKATVDEVIAYQNQFDGRTAWKLCKGEGNFIYAMEAPTLDNPKLIWSKHARMEP